MEICWKWSVNRVEFFCKPVPEIYICHDNVLVGIGLRSANKRSTFHA